MVTALADAKSFREFLYGLVRQGLTPEDAADRALAASRKSALAESLRPYVVIAAGNVAREIVRAIEDEVDEAIEAGEDPVRARKRLADEGFDLPDGTWVSWAKATVEDHRRRATWQRSKADASLRDAARHEEAISLIEAAGVTCLAEIPDFGGSE